MSEDPTRLSQDEERLIAIFFNEMHRIVLEPYESMAQDSPAVAERRRFMETYALTIEMMKRLGARDDLIHKMMVYYSALKELGEGKTHPILECVAAPWRPSNNHDQWRAKATLAIALDYFVRAGVPLTKAAKHVGKTPGISKLLNRVSSKPDGAVKEWRTRFSSGEKVNEVADGRWQASRENLKQIDDGVITFDPTPDDPTPEATFLKSEAVRLLSVAEQELAVLVPRKK